MVLTTASAGLSCTGEQGRGADAARPGEAT
jgi:hypothetical protein